MREGEEHAYCVQRFLSERKLDARFYAANAKAAY